MLPILCSTGTYTASGTLACSYKAYLEGRPTRIRRKLQPGEIGFYFYTPCWAEVEGLRCVWCLSHGNAALKNRPGVVPRSVEEMVEASCSL
jgi:hypothetical protein